MKKTLISAAVIAATCISPAMAHDQMMTIEEKTHWYFDAIDTNHDGVISPAEHSIFWNTMFARADTNHDGVVSYDELLAAKKAEHDMMMHRVDDHDMQGVHLPNRVNTNPSDHSINKGAPEGSNAKYLSK